MLDKDDIKRISEKFDLKNSKPNNLEDLSKKLIHFGKEKNEVIVTKLDCVTTPPLKNA